MRIGFDAKRAFFNRSGLGSYSRDTISILMGHFPAEEYFLYTPGEGHIKEFSPTGIYHIRKPGNLLTSTFHTLWRTMLTRQIMKDRIDIYHGLSHELPAGIRRSKLKTVVTIHDLIFLRYPHFYSLFDRMIYLAKFSYSCKVADKVIAISEQTKKDIIHFLKVPEEKIEVVYQGCNPRFYNRVSVETKDCVKAKYGLPSKYILCVATLESRKNQAVILHALHKGNIDIPLVLAGKEKDYALSLREYSAANQLKQVFFLGQVSGEDLPALYQGADLFIYPSLFEGFGIPILEALNSGVPVITSRDGCFPEAGGPGSAYVDMQKPEDLAFAIKQILADKSLQARMIETGYRHAAGFREGLIAENLMRVYKSVIEKS
jgi:glycosyltransferase involved in cell wall biosynthesis